MSDEIEVFLNKVDAFAHGLDRTEQAMLADLLGDDAAGDDVAGFNLQAWPTKWSEDLSPARVEVLRSNFSGFVASTHTGQVNDAFFQERGVP